MHVIAACLIILLDASQSTTERRQQVIQPVQTVIEIFTELASFSSMAGRALDVVKPILNSLADRDSPPGTSGQLSEQKLDRELRKSVDVFRRGRSSSNVHETLQGSMGAAIERPQSRADDNAFMPTADDWLVSALSGKPMADDIFFGLGFGTQEDMSGQLGREAEGFWDLFGTGFSGDPA